MKRTSWFSKGGLFRYKLSRIWNDKLEKVVFVMLNPSPNSDDENDSRTLSRCIGLAKSWGYGSLDVVNIYPIVTEDPKQIKESDLDRYDRRNNIQAFIEAISDTGIIVLAWGDYPKKLSIPSCIIDLLPLSKIYHLGLTTTGRPRHPLMVKSDIKPVKYFK